MERDDFDADRRQEERESNLRQAAEATWCDEHAADFRKLDADAYDAYVLAEDYRGHIEDSDGFVTSDKLFALALTFRKLADECRALAEAMEFEV